MKKRAPGFLFRIYIGDEKLSSYVGIISYTIVRIPFLNNQYNGK